MTTRAQLGGSTQTALTNLKTTPVAVSSMTSDHNKILGLGLGRVEGANFVLTALGDWTNAWPNVHIPGTVNL